MDFVLKLSDHVRSFGTQVLFPVFLHHSRAVPRTTRPFKATLIPNVTLFLDQKKPTRNVIIDYYQETGRQHGTLSSKQQDPPHIVLAAAFQQIKDNDASRQ